MSISAEELTFYNENKEKLISALNSRGRVIDSKNLAGFVGLLNQGATCYLNSLLQCLFYDIELRKAVYDAASENVTVKALQQLFASMQMSDSGAVDTKDLSAAFGWSKSQVFEQHDVHELFCVLIDALSQTSTDLSASLLTLFQGTFRDVLVCPSCSNRRESPSTFLNVSLDLPDNLEQIEAAAESTKDTKSLSVNLVDILGALVKPEILDADNKWECSGCSSRVQAAKSQEYDSLPPRLFVHLKRFRFDPITRRRRKLSVPVMFPPTLDAHTILGAAGTVNGNRDVYHLTGVLVHNGTAMGGHYRAYTLTVKEETTVWLDCNDAYVSPLSTEEVESLFWHHTSGQPGVDTGAAEDFTRTSNIYESAYMLIYSKSVPGPDAVRARVPSTLATSIEASNEELRLMRRLLEVHRQMVEVTVYYSARSVSGGEITGVDDEAAQVASDNSRKQAFYFLASTSLEDVHKAVFAAYASSGLDGSTDASLALSRLRRYNAISNRVGETYGGREGSSLEALGLGPTAVLLLDRRGTSDAPFVEFNPREMQIRLLVWDPQSQTQADTANKFSLSVSVSVPGEDSASVGGLREVAATAVGLPGQLERIALILNSSRTLAEMPVKDNTKLLKKDFDLWPGDEVVVDILPDGVDADFISPALTSLRKKRKTIRVLFNHPMAGGNISPSSVVAVGESVISYTLSVETMLDLPLSAVKASIAASLGIETDSFHVKRNVSAPQLKDETKTLEDLGFVDESILHLQPGVGCMPGEHLLRFEIDIDNGITATPAASTAVSGEGGDDTEAGGASSSATSTNHVLLGELPVREKSTVLQLKELIVSEWAKLASGSKVDIPAAPASVNHLRIRDGKNSQASGPLRDDRVLARCLLGLTDGRRLIMQVLPEPEVIGPDDVVIGVRLAAYEAKTLSRVIDLPLPRSTTIATLYETLLAKFPQLNEEPPAGAVGTEVADPPAAASASMVAGAGASGDGEGLEGGAGGNTPAPAQSRVMSLAKGFTTGPPLNLKTALKLRWNDPEILRNADVSIDRPPLNLRDGSIIVVRGIADFARAKANAIARRETEGPRPVSAGTGAAAVRAKSAAARKRLQASAQTKEKGLRIGVEDCSAPPLPQPSPEKK